MRVYYVLGRDGAGKTTLTSIIAYNLFLRNYLVGILDLTDHGRGYFFRLGACDFFALGDGSINIPNKLLITLQDIGKTMRHDPERSFYDLPLMPGLKVCLSAPAARQKKMSLARSFLETYQQAFDIVFVEMSPPLQMLYEEVAGPRGGVLVVCADAREDWPGKDSQLQGIHLASPRRVKVVLTKQKEKLSAATRFVEKNKIGVNHILPDAEDDLANSTVMEMCKKTVNSEFLKQMVSLIYDVMLV